MARKVVGIILTSLGALYIFITILIIRAFIPILPYFADIIETKGAIINIYEPVNEDISWSDLESSGYGKEEWENVLMALKQEKYGYIDVEYWLYEENIKVKKVVRTNYKSGYKLGDIVTVYYEDSGYNSGIYVPELSGNNPSSLSRSARIALVSAMSLLPWTVMIIIGVIQLAVYFRRRKRHRIEADPKAM